jgi:hypothetical protein
VPELAPQLRLIDDEVVPVTDGAPGAPGVCGPGPPPPHGAPLSVQLPGVPDPAPMKPNDAEAPGASVPFHDLLRNVKR